MKSEVRSLEQAVCALVAKLDLLLRTELGLHILMADDGLHIITPDHLNECKDDAFVTITPIGWPKGSYIQARFFRSAWCWKLYEGGQIWADHLRAPISGLCFKPADNAMGIVLDPSPGEQKKFVVRACRQLVESLKKGVAT